MKLHAQMETVNGMVPTHEMIGNIPFCACEGCIIRATHRIKIWMPVVNGQAISMIAGVQLCEYHADHLGPYDVIKRVEVENYVRRVCLNKNLDFPDFSKARTEKMRL